MCLFANDFGVIKTAFSVGCKNTGDKEQSQTLIILLVLIPVKVFKNKGPDLLLGYLVNESAPFCEARLRNLRYKLNDQRK